MKIIILIALLSSLVNISVALLGHNNYYRYNRGNKYQQIYKNTAVMILATNGSTKDDIKGSIIFINEENLYHKGSNSAKMLNEVIDYIQDHCNGILVDKAGDSSIDYSDKLENDFQLALKVEHRPKAELKDIIAFMNPFGMRDLSRYYSSNEIESSNFDNFGGYTHALFIDAQIPILPDDSFVLPDKKTFRCVEDALFLVGSSTSLSYNILLFYILLVVNFFRFLY